MVLGYSVQLVKLSLQQLDEIESNGLVAVVARCSWVLGLSIS